VFSPRWNASVGLNYTIPAGLPGTWLAGTDAQFQTKSYANALNDDVQQIPQQTFWNANTRYLSGDGHWTTTLAVKNLLDRAYPQSVGYVPSSGARFYSINDPRTLLLSVRYDL
jgi:iron complex outermembrane receptor protein